MGWVGGGVGVETRFGGQVCLDGIFVDVGEVGGVVVLVVDAVVCKASFPNIQFAFQAEGEGSFDELHCFFERGFGLGCYQEMDVIGHDDKGVELNAFFGALLLKDFYEECGVLFDLEEASAIGGGRCDEVGAEFLWGSWHGEEGPGLKPLQTYGAVRGAKAPR